jgi:uncharacterized membrane protein HdeD (DUF308 family)
MSEQASDPAGKTSSSKATPSSTWQENIGQAFRRLFSPNWIAWAWFAQGVIGIVIGWILLAQLGATLEAIRAIVGIGILLTASVIAVRWGLDPYRAPDHPPYLLFASLVGAIAGITLLFGVNLSLDAMRWILGGFLVVLGALELLEWFERARPAVQSPWISVLLIFAGIVIITYPSTLLTDFTLFAGLWAILLGVASLVRWLFLGLREDRPFTTAREWSPLKRVLAIGIPVVVLGALILSYGSFQSNAATATAYQTSLDPFYHITADLAPGDPGTIVRIAPYAPPGLHGRAWRILFRSQDQYGRQTVSSGAVYAPATEGKDRLIVGWAHGTVGLGPQCAPSRQVADPALFPWVNDMLDHGWVVTAPDYGGAGGTGIGEKYLIGAEQGRDLLNGVRAARNIPEAGAGNRFATYGHSQGGLVSLFSAVLAHSYAPELTLIAAGAVSAASDIGALLRTSAKWASPLAGWLLGPGLVYPWVRYYPNVAAATILTPAALNHYQEIAVSGCLLDPLPAIVNPLMGAFFSKDPTTDPAWRKAMIANQAPLPPDGVPVFIGHGLADTLIDPSLSTGLVARYCDKGANVTTEWIAGVGHGEAAIDAAPHYIQWLAGIAEGKAPASDCGKSLPAPPAQQLTE